MKKKITLWFIILFSFISGCQRKTEEVSPLESQQIIVKGSVEFPVPIDVNSITISAGLNKGSILGFRKNLKTTGTIIDFACPVAKDHPQLVFAEDANQQPLLMCLSYGTAEKPLNINLETTSQTLLFLHPFLISSDLSDAKRFSEFTKKSKSVQILKSNYESTWQRYSGINLPNMFSIFQNQPWVIANAWSELEKEVFTRFSFNPDDRNGVNLADVKLNTQTKELSFVVENSRRRWLQVYVDKYKNGKKIGASETFEFGKFDTGNYLISSPDAYEGFEGVFDLYNRYINNERLKNVSDPFTSTTTGTDKIEVNVYGLGFQGFPAYDKAKLDRMLIPSALSFAMDGVIPTIELVMGIKAREEPIKLRGRNSSQAFFKLLSAFAKDVIKPEFESIINPSSLTDQTAKGILKSLAQSFWDFVLEKENLKLSTDALQELFPSSSDIINAVLSKLSVYYGGYQLLMSAYNIGDFLYTILTGQSVMTYPLYVGETNLAEGMVVDYKFEGNAQDNSHSFDGKLYGNIRFVRGVDGKGLAADFGNNFTDNWIEIKNSKSMGLDQGHTLSYWIKSNENNAQKTQVYFSHYLKETDNWVVSYLGKTPDEFRNRDDSNNTFGQKCINRFDGINSMADGKWHHVVWTAGDTWERGYVDGKLSYSFGCDYLTLKSSQTQFYIGLYGKTGQYPFTGAIDELKIYNRLLNETEVMTLYEAHKTTANGRLAIGSNTTPRALTNPLPLHN